MRRIVIVFSGTITALVLLLSYPTSLNKGAALGAVGTSGGTTSGTAAAASTGAATGAAPAAAATTGKASAGGKAGTYTGKVVNTRYGPVQVKITVAGGKITASTAIQLPSGNSYDQQVDQQAVPILNQEVVAQQSAKIDMISGATFTGNGYVQSLQSALDQAGI
jgi:uncharacterized protein with FMN-binding domain